jgi:hypothetical protein
VVADKFLEVEEAHALHETNSSVSTTAQPGFKKGSPATRWRRSTRHRSTPPNVFWAIPTLPFTAVEYDLDITPANKVLTQLLISIQPT